jgi:hypothetical protein
MTRFVEIGMLGKRGPANPTIADELVLYHNKS